MIPIPKSIQEGIPARKLTAETCAKWDYFASLYAGRPVQVATYRNPVTREPVAQKLRFADKTFKIIGEGHAMPLFGQHLWRDDGKRVIVTEGEVDAMSVSQVLQHKWPVVSLPNGSASAKKSISQNIDWLLKFDEVILCFDGDEPGTIAVKECAKLFPAGRLKIATLPLKDASDMLKAGREGELYRCLWDAKTFRPDGIVTVLDVWDKATSNPETGLSYFMQGLTDVTYGRRLGECVALGAGTGVGKTTWLTQQITHDLTKLNMPVAVFAFEQAPPETLKRVAGMMTGKLFHVPGTAWNQGELEEALHKIADGPGLYLYDHFGACDWQIVKERIRYLHHVHGVKLFYLDHLTALAAMEDDERRGLERIMAEMSSLVKELDIWLLFVSHLATPEGKAHEEGGRVMAKHFKGSRAIMYWSHFMFGLERSQQSDDAEERIHTTFRILKDRYTGQGTGVTIPLVYDGKSGRMREQGVQHDMMFGAVEEEF